MSDPGKGRFIALEGLDGAGKTTQVNRLVERIRSLGHRVAVSREPTDGPVGSLIRQHLTKTIQLDERTVSALFAADRLDHILDGAHGLLARLAKGVSVVCDRHVFSSYAYNSLHVPLEWLIQANSISAGILRPDITIFLDVPPDTCMERLAAARSTRERYEDARLLERVRNAFLLAFERLEDEYEVVIVDGTRTSDWIAETVWASVRPLYSA